MPKLNFSFNVGLNGIITTILGSIQPKHLNTKILQVSLLVLSPIRLEISNVARKFLKKQLWWISYPLHKDLNLFQKLCPTKLEMMVHL
jgi:hypothetical protein